MPPKPNGSRPSPSANQRQMVGSCPWAPRTTSPGKATSVAKGRIPKPAVEFVVAHVGDAFRCTILHVQHEAPGQLDHFPLTVNGEADERRIVAGKNRIARVAPRLQSVYSSSDAPALTNAGFAVIPGELAVALKVGESDGFLTSAMICSEAVK